MANLTSLVNGGASSGSTALDPFPTFAVYSSYSGSGYWQTYDGFQGMIATGQSNSDSELYQYNPNAYWTDNCCPASATWGNTTSVNGFTNMQQADGHYALSLPSYGSYRANIGKNPQTVSTHWSRFGVTINPRGLRQKNSLYVSGTTVRKYVRGTTAWTETFNWTTYSNQSGTPGNGTDGMLSYNDRTKTLVIITTGGSNTYRAHIWTHPNHGLDGSLFENGSILKFMSDAYSSLNGATYKYNDFTWSTSSSTSYTESTQHLRVILGDNNVVGLVRFTPNTHTINGFFTIGANAATVSVTTGASVGGTTSYGIEQGTLYGLRHNITWGNDWVVTYAPYYYYGCGMLAHFISTADPSKYYVYQDTDSQHGIGIVPVQESSFIWSKHTNNNDGGAGLYVGFFGPEMALDTGVAVGSTLPTQMTQGGNYDTFYTSTNYSWLVPMSSWTSGIRTS